MLFFVTLPEPRRVATYHWSMRSCERIAVGHCVLRCAATLLAGAKAHISPDNRQVAEGVSLEIVDSNRDS